jgi:hypothetical protein
MATPPPKFEFRDEEGEKEQGRDALSSSNRPPKLEPHYSGFLDPAVMFGTSHVRTRLPGDGGHFPDLS